MAACSAALACLRPSQPSDRQRHARDNSAAGFAGEKDRGPAAMPAFSRSRGKALAHFGLGAGQDYRDIAGANPVKRSAKMMLRSFYRR